jgi:protein SPIRAL1 and related proteins
LKIIHTGFAKVASMKLFLSFFPLMVDAIFKVYRDAWAFSVLWIWRYLNQLCRVTDSNSCKMGRGVSSGGGQSSLGYLFGGDEATKPADKPAPVQKTAPPSSVDNKLKDIPAGIESSKASIRIEGQNGNFLTVSMHGQ